MKLYHVTSPMVAETIVRTGFRDTKGYYGLRHEDGTPFPLTGVWFADRPLGIQEGCADDTVFGAPALVIELDEQAITEYELVEDGKTYREWCIPAGVANTSPRHAIYEPDDESWTETWWETSTPHGG